MSNRHTFPKTGAAPAAAAGRRAVDDESRAGLICLICVVLGLGAGSACAESYVDAQRRLERAESAGFRWPPSDDFPDAFEKFGGGFDEGPFGLPSLGGIGTGVFGRDLHGHFSRWQLQPGFPRVAAVDAASLCVRWRQGQKCGAYRLGNAGWDRPLPKKARGVAVLWPVIFERLSAPDWPVEVVIESWSPVLPGDYHASSLPVAFFDVKARNISAAEARFDMALFMPNFLGWRPGASRADAPQVHAPAESPKPGRRLVWQDWSNGGNFAQAFDPPGNGHLRAGAIFRRHGRSRPARDMEGEILLGVAGGSDLRPQRALNFVVHPREGYSDAKRHTLADAEASFFERGTLPDDAFAWRANHNEVLGSAVSGGVVLPAGGESSFSILIVWDMPLVEFGSGRTWEKKYTAAYGADGRQSQRIAQDALGSRAAWRKRLDDWHRKALGNGPPEEQRRRGALVNDLAYVLSGGTAWVAKQHAAPELEPPLLGAGEHFAILEGYDTGYHFYNTFDLWPHAQAAFEVNWPRLSDLLLADYLRVIPLALADTRLMRPGKPGVRKAAHKVPHDLGSPPGDPWHLINEYNGHRDSNVWKDHNPAFLLSCYLHRRHNGNRLPNEAEWRVLAGVADFMLAQDADGDALPDHDAQGDSTWDALHFTGPSPYSGSLTLGALAAMADWTRRRGDTSQAERYEERLAKARDSFQRHFWNGRYYRAAANGPQAEWICADALFGILLAESAGLEDILPREHVAAHLRAVAGRNWQGFSGGKVGPALFAPPEGDIPDGVQVGEVLVGSARSSIALMRRYGLRGEADGIADALNATLYRRSGLQFRAPAAWTPSGTYRAPHNLRPLAGWYVDELYQAARSK